MTTIDGGESGGRVVADQAGAVTRCDGCAFWRHMNGPAGTCRRMAPWAGHGAAEAARWPETDAAEGCGDGRPAAAQSPPLPRCRDCLYWREAVAGAGLNPLDRRDHVKGWWRDAGYCVRHAPAPTTEPGFRGFWRVTHATDGCGEGQTAAAP
jgi:hypothetical protein